MKYLPFVALLLLSACGGETEVVTDNFAASTAARMHVSSASTLAVIPGELRAYDLSWSQGTLSGIPKLTGLTEFRIVEPEVRLQDISVSFEKEGSTGDLYRLYRAAFGRTPDVIGLGHWKQVLEHRQLTLAEIARAFLASSEAQALFGLNNTDAQFVERLYINVLKRKPDVSGEKFWLGNLNSGLSRAEVLLAFAGSPENQSLTAGTIDKGMLFAEPGIAYIPVSNATAPTHAAVGTSIKVNGTTSTDANNDKLNYFWTIVTKPIGSNASFNDFTATQPTLTLDKVGVYELSLRTSDSQSPSYSPANVTVIANALVPDSGKFTCLSLDFGSAQSLYIGGHTYLDRDKDGFPCEAGDLLYERSPPVLPIADSGAYTCSSISRETALLMYMQGHTYLDRDKDGKPCEANDVILERPIVTPPPTLTPPSTGRCWVNGYRRKNGTYVSGYYRRC